MPGGTGSIPGQGTKLLHAKKIKNNFLQWKETRRTQNSNRQDTNCRKERKHERDCYGLNACVPEPVHIFSPNPQVTALRGGAFGSWLSLRAEPSGLRLEPLQEGPHKASSSLVPCEVTVRRTHQTPNLLALWSWTSQPLELWEINVYCP